MRNQKMAAAVSCPPIRRLPCSGSFLAASNHVLPVPVHHIDRRGRSHRSVRQVQPPQPARPGIRLLPLRAARRPPLLPRPAARCPRRNQDQRQRFYHGRRERPVPDPPREGLRGLLLPLQPDPADHGPCVRRHPIGTPHPGTRRCLRSQRGPGPCCQAVPVRDHEPLRISDPPDPDYRPRSRPESEERDERDQLQQAAQICHRRACRG
mmetsp:Transcript_2296/g.5157  ORF Transcript_2296/g.5157 Transcript_2296/m.5157 type:complete len:208 (-) Transcript_2296:2438-3061(-)